MTMIESYVVACIMGDAFVWFELGDAGIIAQHIYDKTCPHDMVDAIEEIISDRHTRMFENRHGYPLKFDLGYSVILSLNP